MSFDLRGLPPTPEEIKAFVDDLSPDAYETLVDRFLESPHFGERWARHWMDLVHYSESHGSEGDPDTPLAWRYRDYLIRAFNNDVPYDQLIREHLAGDLLPSPRINKRDGINESIIATAHFRMIEHAYQPVDPWEDRVKWTDNQIDVVTKAFLGLTISCARCHDHKFDAISQKDYYALFGTFYGARPTQRAIDDPELLNTNRDKLAELKKNIRRKLAETWLQEVQTLVSQLLGTSPNADTDDVGAAPSARPVALRVRVETAPSNAAGDHRVRHAETAVENGGLQPALARAFRHALEKAACDEGSPLHAWIELEDKQGDEFRTTWKKLTDYWQSEIVKREIFNRENFETTWDLTGPDYENMIGHGAGFSGKPSEPGEFWILNEGARVLNGIYPGGVYTHLLSTKHNGVIQSPRFKIETDYISLRLLGGDLSFAQLIVENHAVPRGGIYHMRYSPKKDQMGWTQWDTAYWKGFTAYIEFATHDDVTNFEYDPTDSECKPKPREDGRSYIGASRIVFHNGSHNGKGTPTETAVPVLYLLEGLLEGEAPNSSEELAHSISRRLLHVIQAWRDGALSAPMASACG